MAPPRLAGVLLLLHAAGWPKAPVCAADEAPRTLTEYARADPTSNASAVAPLEGVRAAAKRVHQTAVFHNGTRASGWEIAALDGEASVRDFTMVAFNSNNTLSDTNHQVIAVRARPYGGVVLALDNASSVAVDRIGALHRSRHRHEFGEQHSSSPSATISPNNMMTFDLNIEAGTHLDGIAVDVAFEKGAAALPPVPVSMLVHGSLSSSDVWIDTSVWLPMLGPVWGNASVNEVSLVETRGYDAQFFLRNIRLTGAGVTRVEEVDDVAEQQQNASTATDSAPPGGDEIIMYQMLDAQGTRMRQDAARQYPGIMPQSGPAWDVRAREIEATLTLICEMNLQIPWCRLHDNTVSSRRAASNRQRRNRSAQRSADGDDDTSVRARLTSYSEPGPYADTMVVHQQVQVGASIPAMLIVPMEPDTSSGGRRMGVDVPATGFPVIAFGHGLGAWSGVYLSTLQHLASHGNIVIAPDTAMLLDGVDMLECMRWVLAQHGRPGSLVYDIVDVNSLGVTGHSMGGGGALNTAILASQDPDLSDALKAVAPIHPAPLLKQEGTLSAPTFITSGAPDFLTPAAMITALVYNRIRVPKVQAIMSDAGHLEPCDFVGARRWNPYLTAWFALYLHNDPKAARVFWDEPTGGGGELGGDVKMSEVYVDCAGTCLAHLDDGNGGPDVIVPQPPGNQERDDGFPFFDYEGDGDVPPQQPGMPDDDYYDYADTDDDVPPQQPGMPDGDYYNYDDADDDVPPQQPGMPDGDYYDYEREAQSPPPSRPNRQNRRRGSNDKSAVPIPPGYVTLELTPTAVLLDPTAGDTTNMRGSRDESAEWWKRLARRTGVSAATRAVKGYVSYSNENKNSAPYRIRVFIFDLPSGLEVTFEGSSTTTEPLAPGQMASFTAFISVNDEDALMGSAMRVWFGAVPLPGDSEPEAAVAYVDVAIS